VKRIVHALSASCDETARLLSEHADGDFGFFRRWRIEAHLAACEGCRAVYRSLVATLEMLRVLGQVQPDAQPQLVEAVRRRIESGQWDRDD
jgi:predicted anti-sigma-YlaC factor YlaD